MEKGVGMAVIAGACALVLFVGMVKHKAEFLLNMGLRSVMGGVAICGINMILEHFGMPCPVGVNLWTLLTSGVLGVSGVALLYAVALF